MAVDKNLFLYDLAVVAIMKNEGPYVKEWLDYHLLAGVDHFYIYDNDSPDNQREIMQPYIERGLVTYIYYPGNFKQMEAYNDAVKNYKYFCRYMAFIDGDEFIFPQNNKSIVEVVDEIFGDNPNVAALAINWQIFGSNYQDKADYSRGVLERFTYRKSKVDSTVKSIVNPRKVKFLNTPHYPNCFIGATQFNLPVDDKIVVNHYHVKSLEEYLNRNNRGNAYYRNFAYTEEGFHSKDYNEVFDDSILTYQKSRRDAKNGGGAV